MSGADRGTSIDGAASRRRLALAFGAALVALALASVAPPASADHPTTGPFISDNATSMTVGPHTLHYTSYTGCPGGEIPFVCRVVGATGAGEHRPDGTSLHWRSTDPAEAIVSNVARGGSYLYWVDASGRLVRKSYWASSGVEPVTVAALRDPGATTRVAADGQYVYWVENSASGAGRLYRSRGPGIAPHLLVENTRRPLRQLTADGFGGVLYTTTHPVALICCLDMLERVTADAAGAATVDRTDVQGVQAFAVDDRGEVTFLDTLARGGPKLRVTAIEDLARDVVLPVAIDGTGSPEFTALAVADGFVFFQPSRGGRGPILRVPRRGGVALPITASPLAQVRSLGATPRHLFAHDGRDIHRFPLTGTEVLLDVDGSAAPEVVQIIQNEAHDVPMIAGKRTFVRVYGRLTGVPAGRTVALNPPALLYGSRDGVPLPGSPLRAVTPQPLVAASIDRTNLDTTFLFELPWSWRFGTVTLRSTFNESRALVELRHTNNEAARTVAFRDTGGVCLDMLPVLTHAGVSETVWTPGIEAHFRRLQSMYPLTRIYPIWRGGTPRTIPGTFGDHYHMHDRDHKNMLMMNLNAELGFQGAPSGCRGDRLIRTVLVPDSDRFGLSSGIGPYIYAWRHFGNSPAVNDPLGGVKGLAHEVGHQHGMAHVLCPMSGDGAPGSPHESWPYSSTCRIDDANDHIGFDVISRQLIVPLDAAGTPIANDFNSYGDAWLWTSRYTFDKIFSQHAGGVSMPPAPGAGAGATAGDGPTDDPPPLEEKPPPGQGPPGDTAKLVAGFVAAHGTAAMAHVAVASGPPLADLRARLQAVASASPRYELRAWDATGTQLHAEPLTVAESVDEGDGPTFEFVHLAPDDPAIARIAVVDLQSGAEVVARDGGDHAPAVKITAPAAGDAAGDDLTVSWLSSDADGDDVAHLVRYSTDGGATWQVVTSGLLGDSVEVDLRGMPGSADAFVEVIASDGVRSTAARVGPFTVPAKAPSATIMDDSFREPGPGGVVLAQSGRAVLHGRGHDAEDGLLDGVALRWKVTGPVERTAVGEQLILAELPPGSYAVELSAHDADGNAATAATTLVVLPKQVDGAARPVVDGACDDAGYLDDDDPILVPAGGAAAAQLALVRSGGDVYACAAGLVGDSQLGGSFTLRLDPDGSGGPVVEAGDFVVRFGQDGVADVAVGDGKGGLKPVADPAAAVLAVAPGLERWSAELRLDGAALGKLGPLLRLRASQADAAKGADAWPAGSDPDVPGTWGLAALGGDVPPVVTVPTAGVTVSATGPKGALVTYEVGVTDEDGQGASVTCQPPSGSLFPLGTTTVTCVATDSGGNVAVATFDVRVVATARAGKQAVRDALAALLPTGDPKADDAIAAAVAALDAALAGALWDDGDRPDDAKGKQVFDGEAAAVGHLAKLEQPPAAVAAAIAELVAADGALADTAVADVRAALAGNAGGSAAALDKAAKELGKAEREVAAAELERAAERPRQAIVRYRQAWHFAAKARDWALAAG